jgi:hypothetical protein
MPTNLFIIETPLNRVENYTGLIAGDRGVLLRLIRRTKSLAAAFSLIEGVYFNDGQLRYWQYQSLDYVITSMYNM